MLFSSFICTRYGFRVLQLGFCILIDRVHYFCGMIISKPGLNCKSRSVLGQSKCKFTCTYQYCARLKTSLEVGQVFAKTWITLESWFPSQNQLFKKLCVRSRILKNILTCREFCINFYALSKGAWKLVPTDTKWQSSESVLT